MAHDLGDYVEVADRIREFYEKYPEGSLTCKTWGLKEVAGNTFVVYEARAYRTADDKRPGEGMAWEPYPGKTPFTKDSELMNAETSAWGRAVAALGIATKAGIATKDEVQGEAGDLIDESMAESLEQAIETLGIKAEDFKLALTAVAPNVVPKKFTRGWAKRALAQLTKPQAEKLDKWINKQASA